MRDKAEEQRIAIDKLQSQQTHSDKESRLRFMTGIVNVPHSELPAKEKRPRQKKAS